MEQEDYLDFEQPGIAQALQPAAVLVLQVSMYLLMTCRNKCLSVIVVKTQDHEQETVEVCGQECPLDHHIQVHTSSHHLMSRPDNIRIQLGVEADWMEHDNGRLMPGVNITDVPIEIDITDDFKSYVHVATICNLGLADYKNLLVNKTLRISCEDEHEVNSDIRQVVIRTRTVKGQEVAGCASEFVVTSGSAARQQMKRIDLPANDAPDNNSEDEKKPDDDAVEE